jgi:glycosyltransferase involved in cell wall biosynthesis
MIKITIVITNFNYGHFLAAAIDSALDVEYDFKEVIVCDDGSTDNSRAVMASYDDRIIALKKVNGGQCSAFNAALSKATGDIVFLLDSDDIYMPNLAKEVLSVWRPGVSKVQFPLLSVDRDGRRTGSMFPNFDRFLEPSDIRASLLRTGLYVTPPTSGNAFDRNFLQRLWPVPEDRQVAGIDSYLNVAAPLYGDVLTLIKPLGCYRFHDKNAWAQSTFTLERLAFYVQQDRARTRYLVRIAREQGIDLTENVLNNNPAHMMCCLACRRLLPQEISESVPLIVVRAILAVLRDRMSLRAKLLVIAWFLAVGLAPKRIALYFVKMRFLSVARSQRVVRFMRLMGVLKMPQDPAV